MTMDEFEQFMTPNNHIRAIFDFEIPTLTKEKFKNIRDSIGNSSDLKRLTLEGGSKHDYRTPFINAFGYVEDGLAASYYHYSNVKALEDKAILFALDMPERKLPYGGVVWLNNYRKLSFEYIAFAFAIRRTMEYLTGSIGYFFKVRCSRFRKLGKAIENGNPKDIANKIKYKHEAYMTDLSDIISIGSGSDPRSIFAHLRTADANMTFTFTEKGGIQISIPKKPLEIASLNEIETKTNSGIVESELISPILKDQIARVEQMIFDLYFVLGF
jgi:hypothetical protein